MPKTTLFLRDFTVLDCALLDSGGGLRGESWYTSVELTGELDEHGFILDFGPAKKILKKLVDEEMDHRLLFPALDAGVSLAGGVLRCGDEIAYSAPDCAWAAIPSDELGAEAVAAELSARARRLLPANVESVRFELRADPRFEREANFRYTHGLRFHDGNCQRLLHGHRNPIEVWQDGVRLPEWEVALAREWANAHFVAAATLKNRAELDLPCGARRPGLAGFGHVEYSAPQGSFSASLAASRLVLLECEPSIENIARTGHEFLRRAGLSGSFTVRAYEGLNKGAAYSL